MEIDDRDPEDYKQPGQLAWSSEGEDTEDEDVEIGRICQKMWRDPLESKRDTKTLLGPTKASIVVDVVLEGLGLLVLALPTETSEAGQSHSFEIYNVC